MGAINVEGLGTVEIGGDEPTPDEIAAILAGASEAPPIPSPDLSDPSSVVGEGKTGLVSAETRQEIREGVEEMPGLFQFITEVSPATAGAVGGGFAGSFFGGAGAVPGAALGGMLGEFLAQETGVAPESKIALGAAGAGPIAGPVVAGALKGGRKLVAAGTKILPPTKAALAQVTAKKAVTEFESTGAKILASQEGAMVRSADELYAAAKKAGASIQPLEFRKTFDALRGLMDELRVFGAFPEGQQALALIEQAGRTLSVRGGGVPLENLMAARTMIGVAVRKAEVAGGLKLGTSKQVFKELSDVLNRVATGPTAAREGARTAQMAAARAKLDFSIRDFENAVAKFTTIKPGTKEVTLDVGRLQNWIIDVTNPKNKTLFDRNFTEALKDHLPALKTRLLELNEIMGARSAAGPGSIVVRGAGARTGRAVLGGLVGGQVSESTTGMLVGSVLGASLPEMMVAVLTSPKAFAVLKKTAEIGKAPISIQRWIAIGELAARGPLFEERGPLAGSPEGAPTEGDLLSLPRDFFGLEGSPEGAPEEAEPPPAPNVGAILDEVAPIEGAAGDDVLGGGGPAPAKTKAGVTLNDLQPEILTAVDAAQEIYNAEGVELVVTSGTEGKHKPGSLHGGGQAVDFRIRDLPREAWKRVTAALKKVLGRDYDVILEGDHIHTEFDPKTKP